MEKSTVREETVQDVLELKRLKDLELQAVSFEKYLKDRDVIYRVRHRREVYRKL